MAMRKRTAARAARSAVTGPCTMEYEPCTDGKRKIIRTQRTATTASSHVMRPESIEVGTLYREMLTAQSECRGPGVVRKSTRRHALRGTILALAMGRTSKVMLLRDVGDWSPTDRRSGCLSRSFSGADAVGALLKRRARPNPRQVLTRRREQRRAFSAITT